MTISQFELKLKDYLSQLAQLKLTFKKHGIVVQYIRLATTPYDNTVHDSQLTTQIIELFESYVRNGLLGIYSFQPGLLDGDGNFTDADLKYLKELPSLLAKYPNYFSSIQVASFKNGINFQAIDACSKIIQSCANPDPFLNLKFCVSFNVPPDCPFFPSAYHLNPEPSISIALEAADEIVDILKYHPLQKSNLYQVKDAIHVRFCQIYDQIELIVKPFCEQIKIQFSGIDFSPAPYPSIEKSIGSALEGLQLSHFGEFGSVFGVGFLTQALQSVPRPKIGFSGFMQPVLEDYTIGLRNNEEKLELSKLMLFSTMCGLGLDCIPLPGDADSDTISLLLMDIAMIACRLNKPLTARLMPIPNGKTGDLTTFKFEYFTNSKIFNFPLSHPTDFKKIIKNNPKYHF